MSTVFIDVDTQLDFLYPAGALYVPGAERIIPAIARLSHHAAAEGIPLVSTTDAHSENDPEFRVWPHHCVAGSLGQHKAQETLVPGARQIIVEKQIVDIWAAPQFQRVIREIAAGAYVVYGVVTEICVLYAVRGLLTLGKPVTIVTDAIETLSEPRGRQALEEACSQGAALSTTARICAG